MQELHAVRSKETLAHEDRHKGDDRGVAEDEQGKEEELLERMDGGNAGTGVNVCGVLASWLPT